MCFCCCWGFDALFVGGRGCGLYCSGLAAGIGLEILTAGFEHGIFTAGLGCGTFTARLEWKIFTASVGRGTSLLGVDFQSLPLGTFTTAPGRGLRQ